jgi:hypothetical protein
MLSVLHSVKQLRGNWHATIEDEGGYCPVCSRWGKIYARALNRTMARSLLWLCKEALNNPWVDVPKMAPRWLVRSNQLPTLKAWGLVERAPVDPKSKTKHSGMWRPTELGVQFALQQVTVPKKVYTYNDTVQSVSPEQVSLTDCFGDDFDYQATMNDMFSTRDQQERA